MTYTPYTFNDRFLKSLRTNFSKFIGFTKYLLTSSNQNYIPQYSIASAKLWAPRIEAIYIQLFVLWISLSRCRFLTFYYSNSLGDVAILFLWEYHYIRFLSPLAQEVWSRRTNPLRILQRAKKISKSCRKSNAKLVS